MVSRAGWQVAIGLALLGACSAACTSTEETQPVGIELNRPIHTVPARAWRLASSDTTVGYVVLFVDRAEAARPEHQFFSVRNPWQQELGTIDRFGRVWRYVPHSTDPQWLSTGTVLAGAVAILSAPGAAALEEIPLAVLDGSTAAPDQP